LAFPFSLLHSSLTPTSYPQLKFYSQISGTKRTKDIL
jgi:hypothetical protein